VPHNIQYPNNDAGLEFKCLVCSFPTTDCFSRITRRLHAQYTAQLSPSGWMCFRNQKYSSASMVGCLPSSSHHNWLSGQNF